MRLPAPLCRLLVLCLLLAGAEAARAADWREALQQDVERLDRDTPGELGVYVKRLADGTTMSYGADKPWYLGSTAKLPIAVAVLQQAQAGSLRLTDELRLQDTDKVDGSGPLVWNKAGTAYSIDTLLTRMLGDSDNTAANMLVRAVGPERLERSATAAFGARATLTDFTQVRRDVYAELHPDARRLTNRQLVEIAAAPMGPRRVDAVRRALQLQPADLQRSDIAEAYARYYASGRNSVSLVAYGGLLERLVRGELLAPAGTARLFKALKFETRGDYRLEAGLPPQVRFIHKTGTQFERACHMGVIDPQDGGAQAIVLAVCAAGLDEHRVAGRLFEQVGTAISRALLPTGAATK
ncbi:serine hydrolase [Pseudorhodoferax sp. Leaf267]|uniref:serine hydrolase n=1 Tax=Pseudorhodoferax sp. Leaf267 TaxID=1736316 RepID=UPI0006F34E42|nr:serine hydrolase [Pseudorhodoferax sp. Leaf267]KQP13716.1 serine hydrolase [Pseudorhodoferax sp. Leaf267]